jgi:diacylglycerol kinase (ATP)
MRAAAIFGLGCSPKNLKPFQNAARKSSLSIDWHIGLPATGDPADVIVLFGGDGTIHRHLNQLVKLGLPVLTIPSGSGNDFARALGVRNAANSLNAWRRFCERQDNFRSIDLGVVSSTSLTSSSSPAAGGAPARQATTQNSQLGNHRYFCTVAGIGLSSEVARRANELPRWLRGHGGYALTLMPTIFRFAPLPMKVSVPDGPTSWTIRSNKSTILAAFANTSTYGDGMRIAPQAKVDDGKLDVCVIAGIDAFKLFCMFPTVYSGRHLKIAGVEYFHSERLRLETENPLDLYADGEFVCRTPVEISVHPAALKIVTT